MRGPEQGPCKSAVNVEFTTLSSGGPQEKRLHQRIGYVSPNDEH